jgi:membrane protease YdiL (CAAX protease family)
VVTVKRHALLAYFVLAFAIAWGGVLLLAASTGMPAAAGTPSSARSVAFLAMIAGPSLASIAVTAATEGRRGLRELGRRLTRWRVGARWYATLAIAPGVLALLLALLSSVSLVFVPRIAAAEAPASIAGAALVVGLVAGFCEELGWTGLATPRLLARRGVVATGLILGPLWAAWHVLADFWGGALGYGIWWFPHMVEWFVALTAFRILMTWVYAHTRSLLLAILLHATFTGGQILLWPQAASRPEELLWYGLFGLGLWTVLALLSVSSSWSGSRSSWASSPGASGSRS